MAVANAATSATNSSNPVTKGLPATTSSSSSESLLDGLWDLLGRTANSDPQKLAADKTAAAQAWAEAETQLQQLLESKRFEKLEEESEKVELQRVDTLASTMQMLQELLSAVASQELESLEALSSSAQDTVNLLGSQTQEDEITLLRQQMSKTVSLSNFSENSDRRLSVDESSKLDPSSILPNNNEAKSPLLAPAKPPATMDQSGSGTKHSPVIGASSKPAAEVKIPELDLASLPQRFAGPIETATQLENGVEARVNSFSQICDRLGAISRESRGSSKELHGVMTDIVATIDTYAKGLQRLASSSLESTIKHSELK